MARKKRGILIWVLPGAALLLLGAGFLLDGKPIRYSPEKRHIYSVGRDRIDSGGSGPEEGRVTTPPSSSSSDAP